MIPILVAILGPVAGAWAMLVGPDGFRRGFGLVGTGAGAAGGMALLIRTIRDDVVASRGLAADPARAALVFAIGVLAVAWLAHADDEVGTREAAAWASGLAATGAAVLFLVSTDLVVAAGAVVASSLGLVVGAALTRERSSIRVATAIACADVAIIIGLASAASNGVLLPAHLRGWAAGLVAAGILVRVFAGAWIQTPWVSMIAAGPMRIQAFVLAAWIGSAGGTMRTWLAAGAGVGAAIVARRAHRAASLDAAVAAAAGLVVVGATLGSAAGASSSALLAAGVLCASILRAVRPIGASIAMVAAVAAGALGVVIESTDRALADHAFLFAAVPAALALAWLAHAAGDRPPLGVATPTPVRIAVGGGAIAAAAVLVVVPATAAEAIGGAARSLTGARAALAPVVPAVSNDVGVMLAVGAIAGVLALLVAARGATSPTAPEVAPSARTPIIDVRGAARSVIVALTIEAVAIGAWFAVLRVGVERGFL